jgi:hypothetical protein
MIDNVYETYGSNRNRAEKNAPRKTVDFFHYPHFECSLYCEKTVSIKTVDHEKHQQDRYTARTFILNSLLRNINTEKEIDKKEIATFALE